MENTELQLQEKVLLVFKDLNTEVIRITATVGGYGFALRGAHRAYINQDYQNPEKLEEASLAYRKANFNLVLLKCLLELFIFHKDLNGYFTDYNQFIKEIDDVIDELIKMEKYENVRILNFWRNKLPNLVC